MTAQDAPEIAHIVRQHADSFLSTFTTSPQQRRVLRAIGRCRTAALGGHVRQCDQCGHRAISYNSCRNRHCPKCQGPARARWLEARASELLPVPYFHVVFTLPAVLNTLVLKNPVTCYNLLLRTVAETLLEVAANPKRLGAQLGVLTVLHTWGQNLMHHPHVHCVIPAGGISNDGARWVRCREGFFLPVRVLSRVFRGKFIEGLKSAKAEGLLRFSGELQAQASPIEFERMLDRAVENEWVVYSKPPFGGPAQVLKYLARYTHRVAISNARLLRFEAGKVSFRWKDYARGNRQRVMTLDAEEFLRRFLLHVMPRSFVRIRYYGFMSNRHRQANLRRCRTLLGTSTAPAVPPEQAGTTLSGESLPDIPSCCPACQRGSMRLIDFVEPTLTGAVRAIVSRCDTS